ncbi:MAG: hypothetical protein AABX02_02155 [archaeon]
MKNVFGMLIVMVVLAVPFAFAVAAEAGSSESSLSSKSFVSEKGAPLGVTCDVEKEQIRSEANDLFGFDPGYPTEVVELRVNEIPFGIVAKFEGIPFGYGRALPLNAFTHVRSIVVLRDEVTHIKMSGIVYDQEVENPQPELLIGNLFPEINVWDFLWIDGNVYWTGSYDLFPWNNWDCLATDTP